MRITLTILLAVLAVPLAHAQLEPEPPGVATLPPPTPAWMLVKSDQGAYVFDGDSGQMTGMISNDNAIYSPAIVTVMERKEAYMVESFYSRATRGERTDVLTVVDLGNLTTKAEIEIPERAAALGYRGHIGITGDDRYVIVFNQTPAQSVSVVDVVERKFVGEIETPGCAIIMPTGERAFLMICGDGRLQLIELDARGTESRRVQSKTFFSVEKDAVFDQPARTATGWALVSREGLVYEVKVENSSIAIGAPWPIVAAADNPANELQEKWRLGGPQAITIHRASGLLYVLMHRGRPDTHGAEGTEVWAVDIARRTRAGRIVLSAAASHILASQEPVPKLYVFDKNKDLNVYDGHRLRKLRTIEKAIGPDPWLLQTLAQYD
jgi:methylamine dehydrogenase heavy chain